MSEWNFGCLDSADKFIDFESFVKLVVDINDKFRNDLCVEHLLNVTYETSAYVFLERFLKKPMAQITNVDIINFENISFLDDQKRK